MGVNAPVTGDKKMITKRAYTFLIVVLSVLVFSLPLRLEAQRWDNRSASEVAQLESECQRDAGRMFTATDPKELLRAVALASHCPDTGAALIAARWRTPPTDSTVLDGLVFFSTHLIDARLADAALATVQDRSREQSVRSAALTVLVVQLNPTMDIRFGPIDKIRIFSSDQPMREEEIVSTTGGPIGMMQTRGKSGITPPVRAQILESLRSIVGAGSADHYMALAAREALRWLERPPR
jgi:hypothetical protein